MTGKNEEVYGKVLDCAKKEFLKNGFSKASLRTIAAKANVTTGTIYSGFSGKEGLFSAIVQPVADEVIKMFLEIQENFHKLDADKQPAMMEECVSDGMIRMLDYIYDNFESFQLLLDASYGTKFQNFVETLVEIETEYTYKYMETINYQDEEGEVITEEFIHIMTKAMFESMFEVVRHKMSKEVAEKYMKMIERFNYGGWDTIMKFNK